MDNSEKKCSCGCGASTTRRAFLAAAAAAAPVLGAMHKADAEVIDEEGAAGILSNVTVSGYVRCSTTQNGIPNADVDANGIYCTTTDSSGHYSLQVPANATYDFTAEPPVGHAARSYYDVSVGSTPKTQNFTCSHLSGTL